MERIPSIINDIANQFTQNASENDYLQYISVLDEAEDNACCFSELLAIKYNKCILLDKFQQADENKFKENLSDLNALLLSSIVDDGIGIPKDASLYGRKFTKKC